MWNFILSLALFERNYLSKKSTKILSVTSELGLWTWLFCIHIIAVNFLPQKVNFLKIGSCFICVLLRNLLLCSPTQVWLWVSLSHSGCCGCKLVVLCFVLKQSYFKKPHNYSLLQVKWKLKWVHILYTDLLPLPFVIWKQIFI